MADKYASFDALRRGEREDVDYRIRIVRRESPVAVIAPHGGWIEPETSLVAGTIAGNIHSLYCFEGLRDRPHGDLHVTSTNFDEPQCVELVSACDQVIAVHGKAGRDIQHVEVGGFDAVLRDTVCKKLADVGYAATVVTSGTIVKLCTVSNGRIRNCSWFLSQDKRGRLSHILIAGMKLARLLFSSSLIATQLRRFRDHQNACSCSFAARSTLNICNRGARKA